MDRDVTQLERDYARHPEDRGLALRLARALGRSGARARALALAERLLFAGSDPEAAELAAALAPPAPWQGEPELEWLETGGEEVLALAVDTAERRLAIGRAKGAPIEVVDLATGASAEVAGHRRSTTALLFPPMEDRLVSGGGDGAVRLHDLASRKRRARLGGTGSRCLRVHAHQGPDGPLLEGRWRGERYRQPGGEREDFPHVFLDTPHLEPAARAALDSRIHRRVGELFPELDAAGGALSWFRSTYQRPVVEDPRLLILGSTCGRFWALLVAGGAELYAVDDPPDADPRQVVRDPRLVLPRGVPENQPPAAALGLGGQLLMIGGAGLDADAPDHILHAFALDGSREVLAWDCRARVTALGLSRGGGMAAVGTQDGRVGVLRLHGQREAEQPALRASSTPAPVAAAGTDLRETGEPPEDPGELALLRCFPATRFGSPPRACHLDEDRLWVYQGVAPSQYTRGLPKPERPVFRAIDHVDLGTGQWEAFPYLLHGDGTCHAYQLERRWLVLSHLRATPAPETLRCPPLPGKAGKGLPRGPAVQEQLTLKVQDRWPAPAGPLVALRARDRPQEVWVVVGDDPARHQHLELPAPVRHLAWSPRGTRLALTLESREVWLYGTTP